MAISENKYPVEGDEVGIVIAHPGSDTFGLVPDSASTALTAGIVVGQSALDATKLAASGDADDEILGILAVDQRRFFDLTYDQTKALTYVFSGPARALAGEALASHVYVCSDLTSRLRLWVSGVDADEAKIGKTMSACSAAGDFVELIVDIGG